MARRLPSPPPVLAGFTHVHVLGSGGFADVFLFEQNMPRRQVAVKVLLSEVVNDHVRQMFQAEVNVMAGLSSHPSILTVYEAGVSSDGRPYIVMEYCSSALTERYRSGRLPVPEVLGIAVHIGGALEAAHRAGVLHRDIKPSNILLTAYGHPVLSDFGIAVTLGESDVDEAVGMSVPWSAPEVLADETPGTIASEVWSFAATVYSLLAGRSPFEVPGEGNTQRDLIARINRARMQPIGRPDVPASLERALQRAMSRRPSARPETVMELVRELQAVESELGMPQTPVEVARDEWATASVGDLEDRTRVRAVASSLRARPGRRRRHAAHAPVVATRTNSRSSQSGRSTGGLPTESRSRLGVAFAVVAAGLILATAVGVPVVMSALADPDDIPSVSDISAESRGDTVEFRWSDPGLLATDSYQIDVDGSEPSIQSRPEFTVQASDGDRICIVVTVNRDGTTGAPSSEKCVEFTS